jgi:prolipoprotein diacylglyceryltransferase
MMNFADIRYFILLEGIVLVLISWCNKTFNFGFSGSFIIVGFVIYSALRIISDFFINKYADEKNKEYLKFIIGIPIVNNRTFLNGK